RRRSHARLGAATPRPVSAAPRRGGRVAVDWGAVRRPLALSILVLFATGCSSVGSEPLPGQPSHHVAGGFRNPNPAYSRPAGWTRWPFMARRGVQAVLSPRRFNAPRVANDGSALRGGSAEPSVTWVGHSTLLVQLEGLNILTDPHWGERA